MCNILAFNLKLMRSYQHIKESLRIYLGYKCRATQNHSKMISRHIGEFVVLIIDASFHKQSEVELMPVFC